MNISRALQSVTTLLLVTSEVRKRGVCGCRNVHAVVKGPGPRLQAAK